MATYAIPGMDKWHRHAGGTAAAEGKYGYTFNAGANGDYSISPYSSKYGRHMGYILNVWNSPGKPWHHQIGTYRSPQAAVKAAREFAGKFAVANPTYEFGPTGAHRDANRQVIQASSLEEAQRILRAQGYDPNKFWWSKHAPKSMKGRRGQSLRPNPSQYKYRVISSFGGTVVGWHNTLAAARKNAAAQSFQGPLDVWSSTGGQFGQGKVVAHYVNGKATRVKANPTAGPSAIPTRWTPATVSRQGGQIQIRMGGTR